MFEHPAQVIKAIRAGFTKRPVLVVGDLILDRYLWGDVGRISPEAPVPVVRCTREDCRAGGAANVAMNLAGLGVPVQLAGFVGRDREKDALLEILQKQGVDITAVMTLSDRPTITKTRIIGGHQQMLRLDMEDTRPLDNGSSMALADAVLDRLNDQPSALLLSDYAKGVLSEGVCRTLISQARRLGIPVFVDPKGQDYTKYTGATLVSPNRSELAGATRTLPEDLDSLLAAGETLRRDIDVDAIVVTLSELGLALIRKQGKPVRIPAMAREVFDVSGAGDTVIASIAAGQAAGLSLLDTLHMANLAAGVVVGRVGTVPINQSDLLNALATERAIEQSEKVASLETLLKRVDEWRRAGERIVFTNGCFDLLHAGHVIYLEKARRLGHKLIVGLNTDRSVRQLKGPARPVIPEDDRARVLAALASVDAVVLFDDETPMRLIQAIRPDVLVKGADYTEAQVVGGELVKAHGGEVVLIELIEGQSSSRIMEVINRRQSDKGAYEC